MNFKRLIIFIICILAGCSLPVRPVCMHDNQKCQPDRVFTERWFDYYEWAISYKDCQCYDLALNDLNTALNIKPQDHKWIRTIGNHHMDYFPHREKGIILYRQKDFRQAEQELKTSIDQYPSAKAYFFLDEVRKSLFDKSTQKISVPVVQMECPYQLKQTQANHYEFLTNDEHIRIQATLSDPNYIAKIQVNRSPITMEQSQQSYKLDQTLNIQEGNHLIPIEIRNLLDKSTTVYLKIKVDRSGPMIIINQFKTSQQILGSLMDDSGVAYFKVNDAPIKIQPGNKSEFVISGSKTSKQFDMLAIDNAGNQTHVLIDHEFFSRKKKTFLLASNSSETVIDSNYLPYAQTASSDSPLTIHLFELDNHEVAYQENIQINGSITTDSQLTMMSIDIQEANSNDWHRIVHQVLTKGHFMVFNQSLRLSIGENHVRISAHDRTGKAVYKTITIHRNIPEVMKVKYRYAMTIMPFIPINISDAFSQLFLQLYMNQLIEKKRFQIIERTHHVPFQFCRQLSARLSCNGEIIQSADGIEVAIRITDNQSSQVVFADIFSDFDDTYPSEKLSGKIAELIQKILNIFPLEKVQLEHISQFYYLATIHHFSFPMNWEYVAYVNRHKDTIRGSDSIIIGNARVHEKRQNESCLIYLKPTIDSQQAGWMLSK